MMNIACRPLDRLPYKASTLIVIILCALITNISSVNAQQKKQVQAKPKGATKSLKIPDQIKLNLMIRTTLLAFSQANQTGNYSVLRDLSHPQFQLQNTHSSLSDAFKNFRQRNLDLSPIIFYTPKLLRPATIQKDGLLRMTGYFETKPERVSFDLGFWLLGNKWRLAALVVDVKPPQNQLLQVVPSAKKKKTIPHQKKTKKIVIPKKKSRNRN
jgi:hypothetical protein